MRRILSALALLCLAGPTSGRGEVPLSHDELARLERAAGDLRIELAQATQPAQLGGIVTRLQQLEEDLRRLRGRLDEIEFRQRRTDARLDELQAGAGPPLAGTRPAVPPTAGPPTPAGPPVAGLPGRPVGQPPGTLGTLPPGTPPTSPAVPPAAPAVETAAIDRNAPPKERYEAGLQLLQQGRWAAAEQTFDALIKDHPRDALAANAAYWLGETFYIRKDYTNAAAVFARNYRQYGPEATKGPDNLLKLGMSLSALGDRERACQTFAELDRRHANAAAPIKQTLVRERAAAGCG